MIGPSPTLRSSRKPEDLERWARDVTVILRGIREAMVNPEISRLVHRNTSLGDSAAGEDGSILYDPTQGAPVINISSAWVSVLLSNRINTPSGGTLTISGGAITPTAVHHVVDTEGAASSDNLDTITLIADNWLLLRTANAARDVVLTENGNILIPGGDTLNLGGPDEVALLYCDGTSWIVMAATGVVSGEPSNVREGMVAYADGSTWDPGGGAGLYVYSGGNWLRLATTSVEVFSADFSSDFA